MTVTDPAALDHWEPVTDTCPAQFEVTRDGVAYRLRCELDADHDENDEPHAATLLWTTVDGEQDDAAAHRQWPGIAVAGLDADRANGHRVGAAMGGRT